MTDKLRELNERMMLERKQMLSKIIDKCYADEELVRMILRLTHMEWDKGYLQGLEFYGKGKNEHIMNKMIEEYSSKY